MSSGSSYLESPFDILLTADIRKIYIIFICFTGKNFNEVNFDGNEFLAAVKEINYLTEVRHTIYIQIPNNGGLPGIFHGNDNTFESFFPRSKRYWQYTFNRLECSVKRQFTHQHK